MDFSNNKLNDIRKHYISELASGYDKHESEILMNMLIEFYFKLTITDLVLNPERRLSESEMLKLHFAVKDLLNDKPIQYILGEADFLDMKFKVTPDVLIPRPETEELVMLVVDREKDTAINILDIGTGSGCIAISLKKRLKQANVRAIDISSKALEVAKENAVKNDANVDFSNFDILVEDTYLGNRLDVIVSNPPYVKNSEKKLMKSNVLDYEPDDALFVSDEDPLIFYKAIVRFAKLNLKERGRLYFEINENLGKETVKLLEENGYSNVELHTDLNGKHRFVSAISSFKRMMLSGV